MPLLSRTMSRRYINKAYQMKQFITYVPLEKSIPEFSKKYGGLFTCSIGYSPSLKQFIRVYPLTMNGFKKWEIWQIEVERNKLDKRDESFKLSDYGIKDKGYIGLPKNAICLSTSKKRIPPFEKILYPDIKTLNDDKKSIGWKLSCPSSEAASTTPSCSSIRTRKASSRITFSTDMILVRIPICSQHIGS